MAMQKILPLPTIQNWDCHTCGTCCKEYLVTVSPSEAKRVEEQNWKPEDLEGFAPLRKIGRFWSRKTVLNSRPDGSCVFLAESGRCRMHERFGYDSKPLPCKLFPFVLIPAGKGWSVGMRYACPSSSASLGRPMPEHLVPLRGFAQEMVAREGMKLAEDAEVPTVAPPKVEGNPGLSWENIQALARGLTFPLARRDEPISLRIFKIQQLAKDLRRAKLGNLDTTQIGELCAILTSHLHETVKLGDPGAQEKPNWVGMVLFRQAAAIFLRKDHGPNRGIAGQGRLALFQAALTFVKGKGPVPRMHHWIPEVPFEKAETPVEVWPAEVQRIFERYLSIKLGSLQFCGATMYGFSFWEGIDFTLLTLAVQMWLYRLLRGAYPEEEAAQKALSIVDDHYGFNKVLGSLRQRISYRILHSTGQLERLVAWYGR